MKLTCIDKIVIAALLGLMSLNCCHAFSPSATTVARSWSLRMVGGRGWDNEDFLSGLSGDDEDREKAKEDYDDFSERRKAFMERQKEIMKTPQGRAFMEQRQQQQQSQMPEMDIRSEMQELGIRNDFADDMNPMDDVFNAQPGSGGGSRMAQMMAQAQRLQAMKNQKRTMGMGQPLGTPLDEDEHDEAGDA